MAESMEGGKKDFRQKQGPMNYRMEQQEAETGVFIPPAVHVDEIRKQWAVHEDEALAYKLQKQEICEHYDGNRNRNEILRQDVPRAKEAQKQEEDEAVRIQMERLKLLQRQSEEDRRLAKELAKEVEKAPLSALEVGCRNISNDLLGRDFGAVVGSSSDGNKIVDGGVENVNDEDLIKAKQEEEDEELARKLEAQINQLDRDRRLALEAQDREYAKMLHEKEKIKLKKAKEKARLKALSQAQAVSPERSAEKSPNFPTEETFIRDVIVNRGAELNFAESVASAAPKSPTAVGTVEACPVIPDKSIKSKLGFKAAPKPLPPSPTERTQQIEDQNLTRYSVPPYMPMQGYQHKKKK